MLRKEGDVGSDQDDQKWKFLCGGVFVWRSFFAAEFLCGGVFVRRSFCVPGIPVWPELLHGRGPVWPGFRVAGFSCGQGFVWLGFVWPCGPMRASRLAEIR